jgi:hypothetical protein
MQLNWAEIYSLCAECGVNVSVDEDGCCATCGATAVGSFVDKMRDGARVAQTPLIPLPPLPPDFSEGCVHDCEGCATGNQNPIGHERKP